MTVCILDRPRHEKLVNEIRQTGARIRFISDGDVAGAISAAREGSEVDVEELVGVASKLLGAVHRHVGVLEQALGIVAVVGIDRYAYRRGDIDIVVLDPERLRNGRLQLLRDTA